MQESDGLRALKREIKMSREGKVKRKICAWKRKKKERKQKKRMKEKKKRKEKKRKERKRNGKKDMKWMNQVRDE
jgi:hypothetical protein